MSALQADTSTAEVFSRQAAAAARDLLDLEAANTEAGRVVLQAARPPVLTGGLAAGMYADATANGVLWASSVRYWTFVHWGAPRRNIRARPFFLEAVDTRTEDVLAVYAEHADDTIKRNL